MVPSARSLTGTMLLGSMPVMVMTSLQVALPPAGIPSDGSSTNGSDLVPLPPWNPGVEVVLGGSGPARCESPVLSLPLRRGMSASRSIRSSSRQHSHQKSVMLESETAVGLTSSPSHMPSPSWSDGRSLAS